jgi:sphinganine-1-phosphate aldolase
MRHLGSAGYLALAADVFAAVDRIVAGLPAGLSVVVPPDSTLVALATDGTCDAFTVCDEMKQRGWYVQPQMSYAGAPPTIHLSVSAATLASVDELLADLAAAVAAARALGPVDVPQGVRDFIEALDPAALTDDDFDGLLAASGLLADPSAGLALPERMASVNAMLDLASPALRESLLIAFLDRLQRPVRA